MKYYCINDWNKNNKVSDEDGKLMKGDRDYLNLLIALRGIKFFFSSRKIKS